MRKGGEREGGLKPRKARADGFGRQREQPDEEGREHNRDQEARQGGPCRAQPENENERGHADSDGGGRDRAERAGERANLVDEASRLVFNRETEKFAYLARCDDDGDAGGETRHHGLRDIFDEGARAQKPRADQHEPGHRGRDQKPVIAVNGDDIEDDDHKGAGRPADLEAAAAERGNEEACGDRRDKTLVGRGAARDRKRHG